MPGSTLLFRLRSQAVILAAAGLCASASGQTALPPSDSTAQPPPAAPIAPPTPAAPAPPPTYYVQNELADITGRDFGDIKLPVTLKVGDITIRASKCWVWTEVGSATRVIGPDGLPVGTQRLLLQGDVSVDLGVNHFTAAQAVIWTQNLGPSPDSHVFGMAPTDSDRQIRQIAVYFDRVADPGAEAGFAQAADRLLVTGMFDGLFSLSADGLNPGRPIGTDQVTFLTEAETRWQRYLRDLIGKPEEMPTNEAGEPLPTPGTVTGAINPTLARPYEPNSPISHRGPAPKPIATTIEDRVEPLFAKDGMVTISVGNRAPNAPPAPDYGEPYTSPDGTISNYAMFLSGKEDNTILITGGVTIQYNDLRKSRNLLITAQRGVVFLPPGPLAKTLRISAQEIRGIYLEGDVVATDGQYTIRGPRVFYNFAQNKAVMADAVFSTVDARLGVPIYVRAQTLRQEAANQVRTEKARLSTSSFFEPVFSIGAQSITVTQAPAKAEGGRPVTDIDAKGITLRAGGVPFFWYPGFKGEIDNIPLEDIRVENSSSSGAALKTTWNVFGLLGERPPEGVHVRLLIDEYFDRGWAFGTRTDWTTPTDVGQVFAYTLPNDDGHDVLSNGFHFEQDEQFRGILLGENRWDITPNWSLFGEVAKISDPTFVDGFFKSLGSEGRELSTDAYLRYIGGNSQFSVLIKDDLNSFTANQYILESQGYTVNKLPEIHYARIADDLMPGVQPGLLTWTHEYDYSRAAFHFTQSVLGDYGFMNPVISNAEFGVNPNQSPADRLRAAGLSETPVNRADTRQEIAAVFDFGPIRVNPFVVGRFTGYDEKISEFDADSPDGDKQFRLWYAAGTRFSTEIEHIDDSVQSSFFDLHRIRHIITPSATVWSAGSTIREESLPVYDDSVEALATGTAVRAGATNVWQTQRGGPGRWHSVDVLKIDTNVTYSTADRNDTSPFGSFFDDRPEYSFLGNFFSADVAWQVSDAVGLGYTCVYDFNSNQVERTTAGGIIQHNPEFSTFAQVRYLNPLHTTYVDAGANYQLTRIYSITAGVTYDTDLHEIQNVNTQIHRAFQDMNVGVKINYNRITNETTVGVVFEPTAIANKRQQELSDRLENISR